MSVCVWPQIHMVKVAFNSFYEFAYILERPVCALLIIVGMEYILSYHFVDVIVSCMSLFSTNLETILTMGEPYFCHLWLFLSDQVFQYSLVKLDRQAVYNLFSLLSMCPYKAD